MEDITVFYTDDDFEDEDNYIEEENEQDLIPEELIVELTKHMDNLTFKRFSVSCKHIKHICEKDYLSPIINKNVPEVLLSLSLDELKYFGIINRRINNIVRSNDFWYLKLEHDYPNYIVHIATYQSYVGKIIHQDIFQNSKQYYLFYKEYDTCPKDIANTPALFVKFLDLISSWRFIPISVLLKLLSLTYKNTGLDKKISAAGFEKLSTSTLISSLLPEDYNNYLVINGVYVPDGWYSHYCEKAFTPLPYIEVNINCLIHMYNYINRPINMPTYYD